MYKGLLVSKWLSSITNLLNTGGPEAGSEDFICHTQVEVNFNTTDLPEEKDRFGERTTISLFDYVKTLLV